jgi:hypothetical protein
MPGVLRLECGIPVSAQVLKCGVPIFVPFFVKRSTVESKNPKFACRRTYSGKN